MNLDVITAQPVSGQRTTSTVSDKPPSYYDVITSQPHRVSNEKVEDVASNPEDVVCLGENPDNEHENSNPEKENEEEENKKRNRRGADDDYCCCYVSDDDNCVFLRLFSNCCIGIGDCTESCCDGCADCLHQCCESSAQPEGDDNSCCVDGCASGDSGDDGTDCDCNCFD